MSSRYILYSKYTKNLKKIIIIIIITISNKIYLVLICLHYTPVSTNLMNKLQLLAWINIFVFFSRLDIFIRRLDKAKSAYVSCSVASPSSTY